MNEASLLKSLVDVFATGGPYAFTIIFIYLYVKERAYSMRLHETITELVKKGTEAAVLQTNAMAALKEVIAKFAG